MITHVAVLLTLPACWTASRKIPAIRTLAATSSPMYWTNAIVFAKDVVRPLTHINNLMQEFVAIYFGTAYEQCRSAYALT